MRGPLDVSESSFSEFCRVSAVVALQWGTFSRTVVVDLYIYMCVCGTKDDVVYVVFEDC